MKTNRQKGFTLMELVVAMTIMAVLATIGFKFIGRQTGQAKDLKARDIVKKVSEGLDNYYLRAGRYPDLSNFSAMVDPNGPLAKGNYIPTNLPVNDPWGQPFEGVSSAKTGYVIKCVGDPKGDYPPFAVEPGKEVQGQDVSAKPEEQPK